ncbi:MAG: protein-disulfide reductase DsbD [Gammaproteobacteria bacterium]|nr:protein-disulfide reductase DsbD [Gammaproteobacteria bacterium]
MSRSFSSRLALLLLVLSPGCWAEEPLPPDQAFHFEAQVINPSSVRATWTIAPGYYLYRDKIKFESQSPDVSLGVITFPASSQHRGITPDGKEAMVDVYFNKFSVDLPINRVTANAATLKLLVRSQGCSDKFGICYPPQKNHYDLSLPVAKAETGKALSSLKSLSAQLGMNTSDGPLPAEQAFAVNAVPQDGHTVRVTWTIAPDYYMYRDKFHFESTTPGVTLGQANFPPGKMHLGITPEGKEGEVEVYMQQVSIDVPYTNASGAALNFNFIAHGQGCAEKLGICYPPQKRAVSVDLPTGTGASTLSTPSGTDAAAITPQEQSEQVLASGKLLEIIIYFFLGGLALAFTACMYPMIPILSSIIVGQGQTITTRGAFILSLVYVEAMALTFGVIGASVALVAKTVNIQSYFQSPWVLIPFAILFVLLALSMFGFYAIQMPAGLQGKLSEVSNKQRSGNLLGVAVMGVLSALIIGPCAGPVIIGALTLASKEGNGLLGFLAMFVLGNGLGLPLLVVGTTGGKFLPKAGGWMDTVKYAAGVVLLAIALLLLERVSFVTSQMIMLAWATLFIVSGIYLGALQPLKEAASGWLKLWKGLGLVAIFYGALVMLGGVTGARNVNDPLHGSALLGGGTPQASTKLAFKRIKSVDDLNREIALAKDHHRFVMLDFYADWCTYCKTYEDYVFSDPEVQKTLADFVLLQADVTQSDDTDKQLLGKVGVIAPPAILFFGKEGGELHDLRIVGALDAKKFIAQVHRVQSH